MPSWNAKMASSGTAAWINIGSGHWMTPGRRSKPGERATTRSGRTALWCTGYQRSLRGKLLEKLSLKAVQIQGERSMNDSNPLDSYLFLYCPLSIKDNCLLAFFISWGEWLQPSFVHINMNTSDMEPIWLSGGYPGGGGWVLDRVDLKYIRELT